MSRGNFNAGPQGIPGLSTGSAGGDFGGTFPNPVLVDTANVDSIVQSSSLDEMTPPAANINMNAKKLTNLANGSAAADSAAFGQIPTTLPPSGAATGDLTGTYPAPILSDTANVQSVVRSNRLEQMAAPQASVSMNSQKITNLLGGTVSSDAATFGQLPTTLPPTGTATGDLTGTYPAPTLSNTANVQSVVRTNRLDQMAAPTSSVSLNSQKLTNSGNASAATDVPNYGQVVPVTGGTMTGALNFNYNNYQNYDSAYFGASTLTTGILTGGVMTVNAGNPARVDIAAMTGLIIDYTDPANPGVKKISTPAQTALVLADTGRVVTWWMVDPSGAFVQQGTQPTNTQRRTYIQLGITAYSAAGTAIFNIQTNPVLDRQPVNQLYDLMYGLGPFSITGNTISPNGANLSINKSIGTLFSAGFNYAQTPLNPHMVASPAVTTAAFRYATQASGSQSLTQRTTLDVTNYDVGGVVTPIASGGSSATIHRVFQFATNLVSEQFAIQYGQAVYTNLSNAQAALGLENFVVNPDFVGIGILIGYIIVIKSATTLNNPAQATFVPAARFATP